MGLAAGQLIFGPLSDKWGRKPLLKSALILFILATVASIFSPTIDVLNICRFFQGLGGAGGVVLSRSVATDCYSGRELAKTLAVIGAINGIAPVTAPVIGGLFSEAIGWKGIFCILLAIGLLLYIVSIPFRESHQPEKRYTGSMSKLFTQAGELLGNAAYIRYVLIFGMANACSVRIHIFRFIHFTERLRVVGTHVRNTVRHKLYGNRLRLYAVA